MTASRSCLAELPMICALRTCRTCMLSHPAFWCSRVLAKMAATDTSEDMTRHQGILWPLRAIVLALGFAFATSGFGHHVMTPGDQARIAYAAALGLAGEDICAGTGQDEHRHSICKACLIGPFLTLPPVASLVAPIVAIPRAPWAIQDLGPPPRMNLDVANPSRAPPGTIIAALAG